MSSQAGLRIRSISFFIEIDRQSEKRAFFRANPSVRMELPIYSRSKWQNLFDSVKVTIVLLFLLSIVFLTGCGPEVGQGQGKKGSEPIRTLDDWRQSNLGPVRHIVCSGAGALRLATYMEVADRVVAIEEYEKESGRLAPYRIAHPEYGALPIFGEGHGRDNVEFLLNMDPRPDVIIRSDNPGVGLDPHLLQQRTGIPVVLIPYGDLGNNREEFDRSIRLLGAVFDKRDRAESLLAFINRQIAEMEKRTSDLTDAECPTVFLGGLSYRGAHGINSTMSGYPPFSWLHARSVTDKAQLSNSKSIPFMTAREQLVAWNPNYLFLDLATLGLGESGAMSELVRMPIYRTLNSVKNGRVFALFPNNYYSTNFSAQLANGWYLGTVLYPDRFADINIDKKAEEIFQFITGGSVLVNCQEKLRRLVFKPVPLDGESQTVPVSSQSATFGSKESQQSKGHK